MEDARALLDSLMGPSRDNKEGKKDDDWKGKDVCKRFLLDGGFCPNNVKDNWFHNTRRDTGTCKKVHSDVLKSDFLGHPDREKYQPDYEREFLDYLEGIVREAEAWIQRERKNCAPAGKVTKMTSSQRENIASWQVKSEELMGRAEELV